MSRKRGQQASKKKEEKEDQGVRTPMNSKKEEKDKEQEDGSNAPNGPGDRTTTETSSMSVSRSFSSGRAMHEHRTIASTLTRSTLYEDKEAKLFEPGDWLTVLATLLEKVRFSYTAGSLKKKLHEEVLFASGLGSEEAIIYQAKLLNLLKATEGNGKPDTENEKGEEEPTWAQKLLYDLKGALEQYKGPETGNFKVNGLNKVLASFFGFQVKEDNPLKFLRKFEDEFQKTEEDIDDLRRVIKEENKAIEGLRGDIRKENEDIESLGRELKKERESVEPLEVAIRNERGELKGLKSELKIMEAQKEREKEERFINLQKQLIESKKETIESKKESIRKSEKNIRKSKKNINDKEESIKDKEKNINDKEKSINDLVNKNRMKILQKVKVIWDQKQPNDSAIKTRGTSTLDMKESSDSTLEEKVQTTIVGVLATLFNEDFSLLDTHNTRPFEGSLKRPDILILNCSYSSLREKLERKYTRMPDNEKVFKRWCHSPGFKEVKDKKTEEDVSFTLAVGKLIVEEGLLAGILELKRPAVWKSEKESARWQSLGYALMFMKGGLEAMKPIILGESDGTNLNWRHCVMIKRGNKEPNIYLGPDNEREESVREAKEEGQESSLSTKLREMLIDYNESTTELGKESIERKGIELEVLGHGAMGEVISFKEDTVCFKSFLRRQKGKGEERGVNALHKTDILEIMENSLKEFLTPKAVQKLILEMGIGKDLRVIPVSTRNYYCTSYTMEKYERILLSSNEDIKLLLECWGDFRRFVKTLSDKEVFHKDLRLPNVLKSIDIQVFRKDSTNEKTKTSKSMPGLVIMDWGCVSERTSDRKPSTFSVRVAEELLDYSSSGKGEPWLGEQMEKRPLGIGLHLLQRLQWQYSGGFCTSGPLIWGDSQDKTKALKNKWSYLHELEMFVGSVIYEFLKTSITLEANERGMKNAKEWMESLYPNYNGYYEGGQLIVNEKREEEAGDAFEKVKFLFGLFASIGKSLLDSENGTAVNTNEKGKKGKRWKTDPIKEIVKAINNLLEKINESHKASLEKSIKKLELKEKPNPISDSISFETTTDKEFIDNLDQFKRERKEFIENLESLENETENETEKENETENLKNLENALIGALYMSWLYAKDSNEKGNQIEED